jgi:CHASE2 domain-containing sensor protein
MLVTSSPWTAVHLRRSLVPAVLAAVLISAGWYAASRQRTIGAQLVPAYAALAGLLVCGYASLTWLLCGRRAIGERRRQLLGDGVPRPKNMPCGRCRP